MNWNGVFIEKRLVDFELYQKEIHNQEEYDAAQRLQGQADYGDVVWFIEAELTKGKSRFLFALESEEVAYIKANGLTTKWINEVFKPGRNSPGGWGWPYGRTS